MDKIQHNLGHFHGQIAFPSNICYQLHPAATSPTSDVSNPQKTGAIKTMILLMIQKVGQPPVIYEDLYEKWEIILQGVQLVS